MGISLSIAPHVQDLAVGLVEAQGVHIQPLEAAQLAECREVVESVARDGSAGGDERRQAVRQLLRLGGFKPSGRNKPAQEYLLRAAGPDGEWPYILNAVDVLNIISLQAGLPISLLALNRMQVPLTIRYGQLGESFVFNQTGQELKLDGLICVCQGADPGQPVGTPVKDSMFGKITSDDSHILCCIFAPSSSVTSAELQRWTDELAAGLEKWCSPESISTAIVEAAGERL